ncbi:hypothetical protein [Amycolatopsis jejuensis]|uniref:hypothetical protein n=1 Tax=Amycolatopsis jejuensis TaxID=330084 RepID=UPI0005250D42|nr:hypothetical protein [Amycolatopsis jejuensis]
MNRLRRVVLVFAAGVLAVLGLAVVPSASAQTGTLSYTVQATGTDLAHAQDGDPLRITISGLPAGSTANIFVCPAQLRDALLSNQLDPATGKRAWLPNHSMDNRVTAYCGSFNDELSGSPFVTPSADRGRSATTQDVVFDTYVPRGASTPKLIAFDPEYTQLQPSATFPWPANPDKKKYSFSCDENHPCTMMVRITGATTPRTVVFDSSVTFQASAPGLKIQGCGGIGASTLTASMPERFGRTSVAWNQMLCAPTKAVQPANLVAETEDVGLTSFDKGQSDVVITGFGGALAAQRVRDRSYVPVALNATVIAAVGWTPIDRTDAGAALVSRLSDHLQFSWDDVAGMLSKGGEQPGSTGRGGIFVTGSPLVKRNPALAAIDGPDSPVLAPDTRAGRSGDNLFYGVTGETGASTVPLVLSSRLKGLPAWTYGNFRDGKGKPVQGSGGPVGLVTDLNALNLGDGGVHNVDAKTGRVNVRKQVSNITLGTGTECVHGCLNWVVTDLATAAENNWTPIALPNGKGGYVAPTPKSLQAAAAHARPGADGSLQIAGGDDPEAYPLTYVESIAAPVNPLVNASCAPETAKQAQLTTFLKAATNGGQGGMGPGLVPLPPDLLSAAQAAAAKVGTGTAAASCQQQKEAQNPGAATGGPGGGVDGGPLSGGFGGPAPGSGAPALGAPETAALALKTPTSASVQEARTVAAGVQIPLFPGAGVLGALIPLLALVLLVFLPPATGYLTAGKPVPSWVNRLVWWRRA